MKLTYVIMKLTYVIELFFKKHKLKLELKKVT